MAACSSNPSCRWVDVYVGDPYDAACMLDGPTGMCLEPVPEPRPIVCEGDPPQTTVVVDEEGPGPFQWSFAEAPCGEVYAGWTNCSNRLADTLIPACGCFSPSG